MLHRVRNIEVITTLSVKRSQQHCTLTGQLRGSRGEKRHIKSKIWISLHNELKPNGLTNHFYVHKVQHKKVKKIKRSDILTNHFLWTTISVFLKQNNFL